MSKSTQFFIRWQNVAKRNKSIRLFDQCDIPIKISRQAVYIIKDYKTDKTHRAGAQKHMSITQKVKQENSNTRIGLVTHERGS